MKTTSLLTLVSLAMLATQASFASSQSETPVVVLPPYEVSAPLTLPAEQKVNASLNELRQQARVPAYTVVELPLVKNALQATLPKLAPHDVKPLRVAKL